MNLILAPLHSNDFPGSSIRNLIDNVRRRHFALVGKPGPEPTDDTFLCGQKIRRQRVLATHKDHFLLQFGRTLACILNA